jgi:hypothetical protein
MSQMASPNVYDSNGNPTKTYFYSDYQQSGSSSSCTSSGAGVANMNGIFQAISNNFLNVRLIPEQSFSGS